MIKNEKYFNDIKKYYSNIDLAFLKNKSILITGATGLIGSYMIDLIMLYNKENNSNIKIYALSRTEQKLNERFVEYINDENFVPVIGNVCDKLELKNID